MKKVLWSIGLALVVGLISYHVGHRDGVIDTKRDEFLDEIVQQKTAELKTIYARDGVNGIVDHCKQPTINSASFGVHWISCGAAAEFYNPATYKAVTNGKDTILPIGIYLRVENGLSYLDKGYRMKDLELWIGVSNRDPAVGPPIWEVEHSLHL